MHTSKTWGKKIKEEGSGAPRGGREEMELLTGREAFKGFRSFRVQKPPPFSLGAPRSYKNHKDETR